MVTVASIQPHAGPGGRIIECCGGSTVYRITRVRRVVSSPSPPLPPTRPFAPSSSRHRPSSSSRRRLVPLALSSRDLSRPRVSSPLSISTVVDVSVENGRPNDAPGQSRGNRPPPCPPPPVPRKSKTKADYDAIIARAAGAAAAARSPSSFQRKGRDFSICPASQSAS